MSLAPLSNKPSINSLSGPRDSLLAAKLATAGGERNYDLTEVGLGLSVSLSLLRKMCLQRSRRKNKKLAVDVD